VPFFKKRRIQRSWGCSLPCIIRAWVLSQMHMQQQKAFRNEEHVSEATDNSARPLTSKLIMEVRSKPNQKQCSKKFFTVLYQL
jgi:hypothetical protein